jgi:signal transduction protein with GAF and PtsI domain
MKGKTRKTKTQKIKARERREGFAIKEEWLKSDKKAAENVKEMSTIEKNFFRQDLTKTLVLTMLVLALELALWQYLT